MSPPPPLHIYSDACQSGKSNFLLMIWWLVLPLYDFRGWLGSKYHKVSLPQFKQVSGDTISQTSTAGLKKQRKIWHPSNTKVKPALPLLMSTSTGGPPISTNPTIPRFPNKKTASQTHMIHPHDRSVSPTATAAPNIATFSVWCFTLKFVLETSQSSDHCCYGLSAQYLTTVAVAFLLMYTHLCTPVIKEAKSTCREDVPLFCLCGVFWVLIISLVCWFYLQRSKSIHEWTSWTWKGSWWNNSSGISN